jgi:hypothetical protein
MDIAEANAGTSGGAQQYYGSSSMLAASVFSLLAMVVGYY